MMQANEKTEREIADSPFGIHEALHTCSVLMDTFGCRVAEHPAVALRPDILAKAELAVERMMDVYQALGRLPEWSAELQPGQVSMEWQPIETAPIGGDYLTARFTQGKMAAIGAAGMGYAAWVSRENDWPAMTHWMPLPAPPTPDRSAKR